MNYKQTILSFVITLTLSFGCFAEVNIEQLSSTWALFKPILTKRLNQNNPKMKLSTKQVAGFIVFLNELEAPTPHLLHLQKSLTKTTLELLRAVQERDLALAEAEKMAQYLETLLKEYQFKNIAAFDENTSHIIGREWDEIDYSGENMTWQKQKLKYQPYGISNFKSVNNLKKFFPVESKLPYFNKIYQPKKSRI